VGSLTSLGMTALGVSVGGMSFGRLYRKRRAEFVFICSRPSAGEWGGVAVLNVAVELGVALVSQLEWVSASH